MLGGIVTSRTNSGGRDSKPATLALVAQHSGVSPQTVSNALNSPDLLAPETLARVRKSIEKLDYRPNQAARLLRTKTSRLIGFEMHSGAFGLSGLAMEEFLHALSESARKAGYSVLLFGAPTNREDEIENYVELLHERSVDAFILTNTRRGDRRPGLLRKRGIPFVAFGRWSARGAEDWVDVDGAHGTAAAVDHLVGLGHRKIAFLGWPKGSGVGDDREQGWRRAMLRHRLSVRGLRVSALDDADAAREAVEGLFSTRVTAVVAASDTLALGCYQALRLLGLAPGRDVAVIGFDDSATSKLVSPDLSSVRQPLQEAGHSCVRLLLARVEEPQRDPEQILLQPELIVRESATGVSLAVSVGVMRRCSSSAVGWAG
ncbi:LacI family transcriptional regulator [Streptomyces scopuliridis]|uniref:LacI family transcriptional regulator n=2 Tax=Streptomyces scopuliridis TaxID=452529 RepID=A0ACD4ZY97_9ACTN|nr:LacI family transcriptional regulator [Streptomyces scopuliridis]WSC11254.1 LacI family transcriptional regulator [Streptomyces scopuliridis]